MFCVCYTQIGVIYWLGSGGTYADLLEDLCMVYIGYTEVPVSVLSEVCSEVTQNGVLAKVQKCRIEWACSHSGSSRLLESEGMILCCRWFCLALRVKTLKMFNLVFLGRDCGVYGSFLADAEWPAVAVQCLFLDGMKIFETQSHVHHFLGERPSDMAVPALEHLVPDADFQCLDDEINWTLEGVDNGPKCSDKFHIRAEYVMFVSVCSALP